MLKSATSTIYLITDLINVHFYITSYNQYFKPQYVECASLVSNSCHHVTGYGKISHFVTCEINRTEHFAVTIKVRMFLSKVFW